MSADQWHIVVPLAPAQEEWAEQFAASILDVDPTVDPDRAQAAMRAEMRIPRPRRWNGRPVDECSRCLGTGAVRVDVGLRPGEYEYDECPACIGTGTHTTHEQRADRRTE